MIRWLVVGHGRVGRCHVAAIEQTPEAMLVGVVTKDVAGLPAEIVHTDLSEAIRQTRPDAIVIATPHDSHRELAMTALAAGIPVLCEKPVGRSAREAADILAAAADTSTPIGVVLNQRACTHHEWIKRLITSGEFNCRAVTISGYLPGFTGWNAEARRSGGGILRTVGIHYLDLLRWWFGAPTWTAASLCGGSVDDVVQVISRYEGDVQAAVCLSAMGTRYIGPVSIQLQSEVARIRLTGHVVTESEGLPDPPAVEASSERMTYGPGHLAIMQRSTAGLLAGNGFPMPLAELMPLLLTIDGIYAAADAGRSFVSSTDAENGLAN
jgi:predicted dehydrogenase